MFCCGGGPTYYIIDGIAQSDTTDCVFLLLSDPDDWSGQLVEFNSSTEIKTELVAFSSYDKILCHLRRYNNYLYVLYYDYLTSYAYIDIYTLAGSLVETLDISAIVRTSFGDPTIDIVYPIKIAIHDENNIYLLTGTDFGENFGYWLLRGWSCPVSFCNYGDDFSSVQSIESVGGDYIYVTGEFELNTWVKWFDRESGVLVGEQQMDDEIKELYYER